MLNGRCIIDLYTPFLLDNQPQFCVSFKIEVGIFDMPINYLNYRPPSIIHLRIP